MELRHYITLAIAVLALQFLLYCFARTAAWLFKLSNSGFKRFAISSYLIANGMMLIHITQIVPIFRTVALVLTLLLFLFFISSITLIIYWLCKRSVPTKNLQIGLRIAYPIAFFGLVGLAIYNAYTPKVMHYSITLDKALAPMRIGVASDFHLGKLFGSNQLDQLADIFNEQKVDLILLPGDIMDDNVDAYLAEQMQPHLAKLQAPLGVYATLGNHDFFGAQRKIASEIQKAGIQVLWDQAVSLGGKFTIIGRNDELNKKRPTTEQLLQNVDTSKPVFLLDHRPTGIVKHSQLPIDVQVSGHTHNGQIFPANLITRMMYRLNHGYEKIGLGHYFVTSGYGFWGIPMRLGSQSEVMIIDVKGR